MATLTLPTDHTMSCAKDFKERSAQDSYKVLVTVLVTQPSIYCLNRGLQYTLTSDPLTNVAELPKCNDE